MSSSTIAAAPRLDRRPAWLAGVRLAGPGHELVALRRSFPCRPQGLARNACVSVSNATSDHLDAGSRRRHARRSRPRKIRFAQRRAFACSTQILHAKNAAMPRRCQLAIGANRRRVVWLARRLRTPVPGVKVRRATGRGGPAVRHRSAAANTPVRCSRISVSVLARSPFLDAGTGTFQLRVIIATATGGAAKPPRSVREQRAQLRRSVEAGNRGGSASSSAPTMARACGAPRPPRSRCSTVSISSPVGNRSNAIGVITSSPVLRSSARRSLGRYFGRSAACRVRWRNAASGRSVRELGPVHVPAFDAASSRYVQHVILGVGVRRRCSSGRRFRACRSAPHAPYTDLAQRRAGRTPGLTGALGDVPRHRERRRHRAGGRDVDNGHRDNYPQQHMHTWANKAVPPWRAAGHLSPTCAAHGGTGARRAPLSPCIGAPPSRRSSRVTALGAMRGHSATVTAERNWRYPWFGAVGPVRAARRRLGEQQVRREDHPRRPAGKFGLDFRHRLDVAPTRAPRLDRFRPVGRREQALGPWQVSAAICPDGSGVARLASASVIGSLNPEAGSRAPASRADPLRRVFSGQPKVSRSCDATAAAFDPAECRLPNGINMSCAGRGAAVPAPGDAAVTRNFIALPQLPTALGSKRSICDATREKLARN